MLCRCEGGRRGGWEAERREIERVKVSNEGIEREKVSGSNEEERGGGGEGDRERERERES